MRWPRSRIVAPSTLSAIALAAVPDDRNTERRGDGSAEDRRSNDSVRSNCVAVSPGKPTMMSDPIEACGHVAVNSLDQSPIRGRRVRALHAHAAHRHRRAGEADGSEAPAGGEPVTRSTISSVQSIGSSELMRNSTSASQVANRRTSAARDVGSGRSRPYEPRCTPVMTISLYPLPRPARSGRSDLRQRP